MKALSIKQPWAGMIACGIKTIETRTRRTNHRGPLLICASLGADKAMLDWIKKVRKDCGPMDIRGQAICIVDVVDCRPMTKDDEEAAGCSVYPKAFAWVLANVRNIEPVPIKGQLGIYEVDYDE
jgi:hypothetical protein